MFQCGGSKVTVESEWVKTTPEVYGSTKYLSQFYFIWIIQEEQSKPLMYVISNSVLKD